MQASINGKSYDIELISKEGNYVQVKINGEIIDLDVVMSEAGFCSIIHNGKSYNSECVNTSEGKYIITANFRRYEVELQNPRKKFLRTVNGVGADVQNSIKAPMPGKIVKVFVKSGDSVRKGDPLLVIEAMKMQSTYTASQDATVKNVEVEEGDAVLGNQLLISFEHDNE